MGRGVVAQPRSALVAGRLVPRMWSFCSTRQTRSFTANRRRVKDANDRFANTDTGYLLQAIRELPGHRAPGHEPQGGDIDPAFVRRLRYILIGFPMPDESRPGPRRRLVAELTGDGRAAAFASISAGSSRQRLK